MAQRRKADEKVRAATAVKKGQFLPVSGRKIPAVKTGSSHPKKRTRSAGCAPRFCMGAMWHSFRKIAACGSICVVPIFSQAGTAFKGAWMTFCLIEEQTVTFTALRTERNLQPY